LDYKYAQKGYRQKRRLEMPGKAVCCPVEVTLRVIGGRWKVLIIHQLLNGTMRFNQLQRDLTGITHRTLSRQLREMEADQLVVRNNFNEIPPRVEYSLSPLGHSLKTILFAMDEWGRKYHVTIR
jgi:DNA-binding HxlR family transcriptional regulator